MANSELYNKTFKIPPEILKIVQTTLISNPTGEGVKRAKFMLKNGVLTYQSLKRLKNFFDYFNVQTGDKTQYALSGGDSMRSFVERTLNANRDAVSRGKDVRRDMTTNPNSEMQRPRLTEGEKKEKLKKNALAVIVNEDNKILLLKRSGYKEQWMPSKWALVGGGVEKNEKPEKACEREIKEETGLEISNFIKTMTLQRHKDSIEHVFACRYNGEPTNIELNEEHSTYGWYSVAEIEYLDTVPLLMEYISLVFIPYD